MDMNALGGPWRVIMMPTMKDKTSILPSYGLDATNPEKRANGMGEALSLGKRISLPSS